MMSELRNTRLPFGRTAARSTFQDPEIPCNRRRFPTGEAVQSGSFRQASKGAANRTEAAIWRVQPLQILPFLVQNRTLLLRAFLPFVAAYYLSFLFRTINATIAGSLTSEFGLSAGNLGLLTSVYFLTFAIAQIPIGILLDRYGPRRIQSSLLGVGAAGAALFALADNFWLLLAGRALIGLGVAAALTAGLKAPVIWFPKERVPFLNGLMIMLGALGAVTATLPADALLAEIGWRKIFELSAAIAACCAVVIHFVVPGAPTASAENGPTALGLRTIYSDRRFWRLAPLSAGCIGTAWALQGLWAAPWLADVETLDRATVMRHLFVMAIALSVGALLMGLAADRLRRRGVEPRTFLGLVAAIFIIVQLALILRLPLSSYLAWAVVASVGAATVLSYSILADYFPKELAGRANGALNVFHIAGAFAVQCGIGSVLQCWIPQGGHYPEIAFQTAFGLNIVVQVVAWFWFALPLGPQGAAEFKTAGDKPDIETNATRTPK
jgi:MFS family permease